MLNLCLNYMVHVSSTMSRVKNQPSNSISCSDNALRLLVLVEGTLYWGLQVTSSFSIRGCVLKGCFEKIIFWRTKLCLKGIEDFNLEHCCQPQLNLAMIFSLQRPWSMFKTWSPHMRFILKGSQILALQLKGWFKSKTSLRKYRNEIQNPY